MWLEERSITSLLTGAGTAMVALTSTAIIAVTYRSDALHGQHFQEIALMVLTSACATIFVLSLLHADLRKHYAELTRRETAALAEARSDSLTGLRNRKALVEALEHLSLSQRANNECSALVFLDLDHFKNVNDTLGHEAGDKLLEEAASRLLSCVANHECFRLGGDEFALILEGHNLLTAEVVCRQIHYAITRKYQISGYPVSVGCSMGIALICDGLVPSVLMSRADLAMYKAKFNQSKVVKFDEAMLAEATRKSALTIKLREALTTNAGLSTKYQPIFDRDLSIVGLEGLFRWHDPEYGNISPIEAIQIGRENHLLDQISLFVVERSQECLAINKHLKLSLNVEATQLLDETFPIKLSRSLQTAGIDNERILLEVRESDLVEYGKKMSQILASLVNQGYSITVDDFGSSNTSLTHLRELGISSLKFDTSILANARETGNTDLIKAKVNLGHSLGMTVACKCIATEQDFQIAIEAGCDLFQGYRFGRPTTIGSLVDFLELPKLAANA